MVRGAFYHLVKCLWFLNNWMLNKIEARLRLCKCTVICKNSVGILGSTHDDFQSSVFLSNLFKPIFFWCSILQQKELLPCGSLWNRCNINKGKILFFQGLNFWVVLWAVKNNSEISLWWCSGQWKEFVNPEVTDVRVCREPRGTQLFFVGILYCEIYRRSVEISYIYCEI